jgi:hypothetical protein
MAKRFTSTEIWLEDWFIDIPNEYKLFWFFMLANCNHAGIYKVNLRSISRQLGVDLSTNDALSYFNDGKSRIRVVSDGIWLIEDFFVFQYGRKFSPTNRVHVSIQNEYEKLQIDLGSIRGLEGVKDKDKDKDKDITTLHNLPIDKLNLKENFSKKINLEKNENPSNGQTQEHDFLTRRLLAIKEAERDRK